MIASDANCTLQGIRFFLWAVVLFIVLPCSAQNLVPNPSFEDFSSCPAGYNGGFGPLLAEPWYVPTNGSSDYFNACNGGVVGVPSNAFGVRPAHTGVAYGGGLYYYQGIANYREYLQVQLTEPMVAGTSYVVSLYCSVGELTCPIDKLGIYISNDQITAPSSTAPLDVSPQIEIDGLIDNTDWELLTGCYVALGGEEWITIGNFYSDAESTLGTGCPLWGGMTISYVFIDDVSVEEGPPPGELDFSLGPDTTVCGDFVIDAPVDDANYLWQDGSHDQSFTATETGTYSVTITKGCNIGEDSIEVTILDVLDGIDLGDPEQIICPGDQIVYNFDPNLGDYLWQDNSTSSSYTITGPGTYAVTLTNQCGSVEDEVVVTQVDPPAPIDLGEDQILCPLEQVVLSLDPGLGDFMWQDGSTESSFTVTEPGEYAVTVSNICGAVSDTINIDYYPEPLVLFGEDTVKLCDGESVTFNFDPGIGDYIWQDGSSGPDYTVTEPGIYSVTVVNPCGSDFDNIVVDYDYEPQLDLGPDLTLCPQQLPYTINLTGLPEAEHFVWDDGSTDPIFTVYEAGSYGVTVSNDCYTVSDFIVIDVEDASPDVQLPADTVLCPDEILFLDISNIPGDYVWQDGTDYAVYGVSESGTYSVTVTNACGTDSDTIIVGYVDALPQPDLGPNVSLCPGETITFHANVTGADYLWQDGSTLDSLVVGDAGTVILTVSNVCETLSDTVDVTVNGAAPDAGLPDQLSICAGDSTVIQTGVGGATYQWNTGATTSSITVSTTGTYILTVTNSCGMDVDTTIVTDNGGIPQFDLGVDQEICAGDSVVFDPGTSGTYLWQDGSTGQTYTAYGAGEVILTVTNQCGSASDTVDVSMLDAIPTLDLGQDTSVCPGTSVVFDPGIGNVNYLWSDGSTGGTFTSTSEGAVFLEISNSCGKVSDTVLVNWLPDAPVLNLGADFSICPGESVTIDPGIPGVQYLWQDGSTGNTYEVSGPGQVILTISNACGSASDTVNVAEDANGPVLDLGADISECEGETVVINPGLNGVQYLWQDGSTGSTFTATTSTTVILEVTNACGSARDTLEVTISGTAPEVDLGADQFLCDGASVMLNAGSANGDVEWSDGSTDPDLLVSTAGQYMVTVTNACGMAVDSVIITTGNSPQPFDLGPDQEICPGEIVTLQAPTLLAGDELTWSTGSAAPMIDVSQEGSYILEVSNACGTYSDTIYIAVDEQELLPVMDTVYRICKGDQVVLDVTQPIPATYTWSTGASDAVIDVSQVGNYVVTITSACDELVQGFAIGEDDCLNPNVFIPNVFSPNHDNINDVFHIDFDKQDLQAFHVWIYDRWGELLYTSEDPDFEWQGDYLHQELNPGVYVYSVLIERAGEKPLRLKGDVTLVR